MHNSRMQTLRNARLLGRLVILWLVLSLGVAVASPLLKPVSMDVVCSASGAAIVFHDDALRSSNPSGLHCPLCLPLSAPPPVVLQFSPPQIEPSSARSAGVSAKLQTLRGKPWQARAPPSFQV